MITLERWTVQQNGKIRTAGAADEGPLPPAPVIPPDVTRTGLPARSGTVEVDGAVIDYLPVSVYCKANSCKWSVEVKGAPWLGIMTPDGKHVRKYDCSGGNGQFLYAMMGDPKTSLGNGTVVRQSRYWKRLTQSVVPANTPHETSIAVTSGITETQGETMSFSVGASVGFDKVIQAQLSTELSKSFSFEVAITNETTVTDTFSFPPLSVTQVDGVYQLVESFSVSPGPDYAAVVAEFNQAYGDICRQMGMFCSEYRAEVPFEYPGSTYLQVVGTDSTAPAVRSFTPASELRALIERTVLVTAS